MNLFRTNVSVSIGTPLIIILTYVCAQNLMDFVLDYEAWEIAIRPPFS